MMRRSSAREGLPRIASFGLVGWLRMGVFVLVLVPMEDHVGFWDGSRYLRAHDTIRYWDDIDKDATFYSIR